MDKTSQETEYLEDVVLVVYTKDMVTKYNEWMQDELLLRYTGSEPLSLEEEYSNQETWLVDPLKYTYIICDKERFN